MIKVSFPVNPRESALVLRRLEGWKGLPTPLGGNKVTISGKGRDISENLEEFGVIEEGNQGSAECTQSKVTNPIQLSQNGEGLVLREAVLVSK